MFKSSSVDQHSRDVWGTLQLGCVRDMIFFLLPLYCVGGMVRMSIGESGEKLMVSIMQLLLLCIPAYNRIQLRYLLHFMNHWNLHHSLCVQTDVSILQTHCS
jgi:hypothetical protein